MNLVNSDFPEKIILSRNKDEILNVFLKKIPKELISKCKFVLKLKKDEQLKIFGLSEKQLSYASDREFSVPLIFKGNKVEKNNLFRLASDMGLKMQEGGPVEGMPMNEAIPTEGMESMPMPSGQPAGFIEDPSAAPAPDTPVDAMQGEGQ